VDTLAYYLIINIMFFNNNNNMNINRNKVKDLNIKIDVAYTIVPNPSGFVLDNYVIGH